MSDMKSFAGKAIPGRYEFAESNKKKTPYVEVMIQTYDINGKELAVVPWQGWLTEATIVKTVESLQLLGARVAGGDIADMHGLGSKEVNVQVENTDYGLRVAFINPPGNSSVSDANRMSGQRLDQFRAMMRSRVLGAQAAAGTATQVPSPAAAMPWSASASPAAFVPSTATAPARQPDPWELDGANAEGSSPLPAGRLPPEIEAEMAKTALASGVAHAPASPPPRAPQERKFF